MTMTDAYRDPIKLLRKALRRAEALEAEGARLQEALTAARRGMSMIHGGLADSSFPRQSCGEMASTWLDRIDAALAARPEGAPE